MEIRFKSFVVEREMIIALDEDGRLWSRHLFSKTWRRIMGPRLGEAHEQG
jgi:hypothetical protein